MPFDGTAASTSSMLKLCTGAGAAPVHVRRDAPMMIRLTSAGMSAAEGRASPARSPYSAGLAT
jgi:hypothetical protein